MRSPDKIGSLQLLRDRGVEVGTVLDVGVLSETPELCQIFPDKHHVLFEPVVEYNELIAESYRSISHEVHNVAISNSVGEVTLELRALGPGLPITHSGIVDEPQEIAGREYRPVQMTTLDAFLAERELELPFLLKIDIDGHELAVLEGAQTTLKKTSVVIVEAPKAQFVERIAAVQRAGFEIYDLAEPVYYDGSFWQCDVILIHREIQRQHFRHLGTNYDPSLYEMFKA